MEKIRTISLSTKEIQDTIKELRRIKSELQNYPSDIESTLDQAVEYCKSLTPSESLRNSTYWEKTGTGYRIVQEGDGVAYVEFGTGVVGKEAEHHPLHGEMGMYEHDSVEGHKFIAPDGRRAWAYPKKEGGWGMTSGQPAHMQMYKTGQWLEEKLGVAVSMSIDKVVKNW